MSGVRGLLRRKGAAPDPQDDDEGSAPRVGPPRIAAITLCRDEGRMLPVWLRYYGAQLGVENLYVVDDNSEDGSTDDLPCDVLRIPPIRDGKFESTRMALLGGLAQSLRAVYDCVVFCDVDEFIVPDPARHDSLRDFIASREPREGEYGAVGALGFNVVHLVGSEPPLDLDAPVLGQRRVAKFLPVMCKPSINFAGAPWRAASHGIRTPYAVDPELWMFHLKFADRDHLQQVADHRLRMVEQDGRSRKTQWRHGGDTLVDQLVRITEGVDPAQLPEFVPPTGDDLAKLVIEDPPGSFRAPVGSQMRSMERRPLYRIPERFLGTV